MIEIKDIYKAFGENEVLKGISGKFEAGVTNLMIYTNQIKVLWNMMEENLPT